MKGSPSSELKVKVHYNNEMGHSENISYSLHSWSMVTKDESARHKRSYCTTERYNSKNRKVGLVND